MGYCWPRTFSDNHNRCLILWWCILFWALIVDLYYSLSKKKKICIILFSPFEWPKIAHIACWMSRDWTLHQLAYWRIPWANIVLIGWSLPIPLLSIGEKGNAAKTWSIQPRSKSFHAIELSFRNPFMPLNFCFGRSLVIAAEVWIPNACLKMCLYAFNT